MAFFNIHQTQEVENKSGLVYLGEFSEVTELNLSELGVDGNSVFIATTGDTSLGASASEGTAFQGVGRYTQGTAIYNNESNLVTFTPATMYVEAGKSAGGYVIIAKSTANVPTKFYLVLGDIIDNTQSE